MHNYYETNPPSFCAYAAGLVSISEGLHVYPR